MFHRISDPADPGVLECFERFILELGQAHRFVLPGEPLDPGGLSLCLTFDDAYYDFYHAAFPFLRSHAIKSVVAVPTRYIIDETLTKPADRLRPLGDRLRPGQPYEGSCLCTWRELNEMHESGFVAIASHGHSHMSLVGREPRELETELVRSRELLERRLDARVTTLVYPFGHFDGTVHARAMASYDYLMRIGSAVNFGWGGRRRLLYRVNADPFWQGRMALHRMRLCGYAVNWLKNRSRRR